MKNLLIAFLCTVMAGNPANNIASDNVFVPSGAVSWSETVISGDINGDGKVNIADAVLLQKYLMADIYESSDFSCLDVNFDGIIDSFDMVLMRQCVLYPENVLTRTYSVDILKSAEDFIQSETILTSIDELSGYLSEFITDDSEVQSYLERYNDEFFEENNLVLAPFVQERGRGIFYNVSSSGKAKSQARSRGASEEIYIVLSAEYGSYQPLYPITNTNLLAQVTVPKSQSSGDNCVLCFDSNENTTNMSSHIYMSPDGETQLYITQEALNDTSDIRVFLKTGKISFKALTYLEGNGCTPFSDDGEWSVDEDGNEVFGDGMGYSITWLDDAVIIDHQMDGNKWEKVFVPFDKETIDSTIYTKE